ncbi:MAG: ABC transporter ATP-binding protein [Chloroflexia bacterium]
MISAAPASPAIHAQSLGKSYGVAWALRSVTLEVAAGEVVAVFGPNGAGKSTLIRLLATLSAPSSGKLHLLGHDAVRSPQSVRPALGVLGQQSYLYADLTVSENLLLYARLYRLPAAAGRVRQALEAVGLSGAENRRVRECSRGMQQRLALARATIHRPAVLLLDEPDSGLDLDGQGCLALLLAAGRDGGQAVVLTTHNLELGLALGERGLVLERGRLVFDAPASSPEEWRAGYEKARARVQ